MIVWNWSLMVAGSVWSVMNRQFRSDSSNLAWRAAEAFFELAGIRSGMHLRLTKTDSGGGRSWRG